MKFIQKIFYILISLLFLYFLANSFINNTILKSTITNTTITWFNYILPSVSISYVTSIFLYNYPLISKLIYKPLSKIYHFENEKACSIFLISIIVGNPCSVKLITNAFKNEEISINEANRLLKFSTFVSSIFLFYIFDSYTALFFLIIELITSILIAFFNPQEENKNKFKYPNIIDTYYNIISSLPSLLLNILSSMIICSIFSVNLNNEYLNMFIEITNGILILKTNYSFLNSLLLIILISSNGISIILQSLFIIKEKRLSLTNFIVHRTISIIISVIVFLIIYLFIFIF